MTSDATTIDEVLEQYRFFDECLLREVRSRHFGTALDLQFDYIWDDTDPARARLADEFRRVTISLGLVREVQLVNDLPMRIIEEPARAGWGLTEVSLVRREQASALLSKHRAAGDEKLQHLVVRWESNQQIDVIFQRFEYFEASQSD